MRFLNNIPAALICVAIITTSQSIQAQNNINRNQSDFNLLHGIQQYEDGHYVQAIHSLEGYLKTDPLRMVHDKHLTAPNLDKQRALFYLILSKIRYGTDDMEEISRIYIDNEVNTVYRDRVGYQLAKHYFIKQEYDSTIRYYEKVDMKNLNNEEIAELKFELAYSYFVNSDFDKSYQLFASIKELEGGKYFFPGNYYYGLLAYNKKQYNLALNSFKRIEKLPEYSNIVPYYIFEIYYFSNEYDKILREAPAYLNSKEKLFYHNDLNLLMGKVHYERKEYDKALPFFKYYYDNTDKIRKENLYEYAFTNYSLGHFNQAIELFRPLSNTSDSLGQNSMYLLGDSYLKIQDKPGAKNAFFLAQNMDHIPSIKESSHFLYAKLAYDQGDFNAAAQSFNDYVNTYPSSSNKKEAQEHLVTILSKSKNYESAYDILSQMKIDGAYLQSIYQTVTLGRALQLLKSSHQKESALKLLQESLKYPVNRDVQAASLFWKSYVLYDMKEYGQSEKDIQEYLSIVKNNDRNVTKISQEASVSNAHTHLGYVQMSLEKYNDARKNFASAGQNQVPSGTNTSAANLVLQADAAFMSKNFQEADALYNQALTEKYDDPAYLLYQRALIAGVDNRNDEKMSLLSRILKDYPQTELKQQAEYELAVTYNLTGKYDEAIALLKQLVKVDNRDIMSKSMLQLANTYQKKNDSENAIATYKLFIKTFPNHPDREEYLETLYAMYIARQDPKGYQDFLRDNKIEVTKNISDEQSYFDIAENRYLNDDYNGAIESFLKYKKDFPGSSLNLQVDYYLAQAYSKVFRFNEAKTYYERLLASSDDGFRELALVNLIKIENDNDEYAKSMEYISTYGNYEKRSEYSNELLLLELNNLSHLDLFENFEAVLQILEERNNLTKEQKDWLELYSANSELHFNPNNQLLSIYDKLSGNGNGELAAESRVRKAQLLLKLNQLKEAEKAGDLAIDKNNDYNFWLVKSYIVIAEVLAEQDDFISARATIQSVINNVKSPVLKSQAEDVLNKVNELESLKTNVISED